jgi:hypothetical protein
MKANELRIGNYVKVNDLVISIHRIESDRFYATHKNLLFFNGHETQPIHLTEKWLLKLGFEYSEARFNNSNGFEEFRNGSIYLGNWNDKHYIIEALDQGGD